MSTFEVIFMWSGRRMGEIVIGYNDGDARQQIRQKYGGATIISARRIR